MPWASIVGDAHEQNQPHNWEKKVPAHSHTLLDTLNGGGGEVSREPELRWSSTQTVAPPPISLHYAVNERNGIYRHFQGCPHGDPPRYANWISIGTVIVIHHLQYYEALLCAQDIRNRTNFHVKNQILQRLGQLTMADTAHIATLRSGRPLGICSGKISKHTATQNVISHLLGALLRSCLLSRIAWLRCFDQYLAHPNLIGITSGC